MFGLEIGFDKPWFLLLLVIAPIMWFFSFRSLAGLGHMRRMLALILRTSVLCLLVAALAEIQLLRTSDKMTVIYLLDQSLSIPEVQRHKMLDYVVKEVANHRNQPREDRAGIIVFGRDALIEIPPFDDDIPAVGRLESTLNFRADATNLTAALKLAQASFPEDSAKRIVIVSDGNENIGDARAIAPSLTENGIGIDVVPVQLSSRAEVAVEKIALPVDIRRGQTFETRVVLNNYSQSTAPGGGFVKGKVRILRRLGQHEELLSEQDVVLAPGKNVLTFDGLIDQPAVYTYRAEFSAENENDDLMKQNNKASAFTHVRGRGRILLIEDWQNKGDFDFFVERLRAKNLEVDIIGSDQLFTSPAELLGYDSIVLANVPRSSGDSAQNVTNFSDEQIKMLVRNTEQMGCGLVMIGGNNSFGAGGWANTELEKAMPVDFQIKNEKIQAVGALVLMMHASEMAQGNYWQKVVGVKSIESLGPMDYCGLVHWGIGGDSWLWGGKQGLVRIQGRRKRMMASLNRMTPGDMPQFDPAMRLALAGFNRTNASVKHMIIISDGDPSPPSNSTVAAYVRQKIQISTVAIGTHGAPGSTPLQNLARRTGGKYYVVSNPKALPKIYQTEARRVSRPLLYEPSGGITPQIKNFHEMLEGIDGPLPPIRGFVLTTLKDNSLAEQLIVSPKPDGGGPNSTILASWTYKAGRTAVLTTDAGHRWADNWTEWENYDKLFSQLVRWSMRPINDQGKFTVSNDIKDGKVRVVVTALDKDDEFLNFLDIVGSAIGPDLEPFDVKVRQISPGRYVGEFDADQAGSYFLTINPGEDRAPILTGIDVPYSSEFRDRETNLALLTRLASLKPSGGEEGVVIKGDIAALTDEALIQHDTFRPTLPKAISSRDVWPLILLIASCLFFADIFVRRVTISFDWVAPAYAAVRNRLFPDQAVPEVVEQLQRLQSKKKAIAEAIDQRRSAARFEPQADADVSGPEKSLDEVVAEAQGVSPIATPPKPVKKDIGPKADEEDSYTSRLLQAKKKAFKDKNK